MKDPVKLPDVTLIAVDTVAHHLTRMAIDDTLRQIEPARVIVWSDKPDLFKCRCPVERRPLKGQFSDAHKAFEYLWYEVWPNVKTSHCLTIQWDGWVIDGSAWDPSWLEYDYIGAPWPWHHDGYQVGNGGFSLRSTRLARYIAGHPEWFSFRHPEDEHICRVYRPALEAAGFRWPSIEDAWRFSFEHGRPAGRSFGFHDIRNWRLVLSDKQIDRRLDAASAYVVKKTDLISQMLGVTRL